MVDSLHGFLRQLSAAVAQQAHKESDTKYLRKDGGKCVSS